MFCPQCRVEYRPGFTHCTDCDVGLVETLPMESQRQEDSDEHKLSEGVLQDGEALRVIWEGDSSTDCVDVCQSLQDAGIEYRVNQSVAGRELRMQVDFHYRLAVRAADYAIARKALGYSQEHDTEWSEEDVESGVAELPAQDDRPVEEVHGDWNQRGWYPEDATQEIWWSNPKTGETIVEMALKENRINYRIELSNEFRKVFVLPEDEPRAREIVREIKEGAPPG